MTEYVALKRIRFGDDYLLPGDKVPQEGGRDYDLMVQHGDVGEVKTAAERKEFVKAPESKETEVTAKKPVGRPPKAKDNEIPGRHTK